MDSQTHFISYIWQIYLQIITFFINYYNYRFRTNNKLVIKPINKLTDVKDYIQYNTDMFLHSFTKNAHMLSSNIEPVFYNKTVFQEEIQVENNNIETAWKRRVLFETTPYGNIIMFYDAYKQGFSYYSDTNGISYSFLNAVAIKYVLTFFCRDFFMDDQITPEDSPSPFIEIYYKVVKPEPNDEPKSDLLKSAPFAKFKNYNKDVNTNKKSSDNIQHVLNKHKLENEYNRNKFYSLGKITNFQFLQPVSNKHFALNGFQSPILDDLSEETVLQKQVLSYKDFKKISNGNKDNME
jgi:hypothetical protein